MSARGFKRNRPLLKRWLIEMKVGTLGKVEITPVRTVLGVVYQATLNKVTMQKNGLLPVNLQSSSSGTLEKL